MIPADAVPFPQLYPFPRTRGGDPVDLNVTTRNYPLFPARAGVIPKLLSVLRYAIPFPRTCGGDPETSAMGVEVQCFSPHTRG